MDAILCSDARPLIPAWADGELSEAQAAPLRSHLLGCRECRGSMQDLRALQRWFEAGEVDGASLVPPGFAARVARRAFAGDRGERGPIAAPALVIGEPGLERRRTLSFVLWSTAAAAMLVVALSVALRLRDLPAGERLRAEDRTPQTTEEILRALDELDQREAGIAPAGSASQAAPAGAGGDQGVGVPRR